MSKIKRIFALALGLCCFVSSLAGLMPRASAAEVADAIVDMDKTCTLDLYLFDWTNATKDGVWGADSYVSTGQYDEDIHNALGNVIRKGADNKTNNLENNDTSNGYAIAGVEFTYLKVADFMQFAESASNSGDTTSHVEVLYKFDKTQAADLLAAIGLSDGKSSVENANALNNGFWCYQSDVLNAALRDALENNPTTVKNALEDYVKNNNGTQMPATDADGFTNADDLPVGLYLLVQTKVPEMIINTTNPFFVSLPMTTVNGGSASDYDDVTTGGQNWIYDVTVYPKNETGIVTLEKTVREDNGENAAYKHNATASGGDTVNYQIISTLPTITSAATYLSEYTFQDILAQGLRYDENSSVQIEIFSDTECQDLVAVWSEDDTTAKFTVKKTPNADGSNTMTIQMTSSGLAQINTANTSDSNSNNKGTGADGEHLYAGYSNYTMRISYNAVLNSDASMIYGDEGNCNEVVLTWRRTSDDHYDTLIDDCHVYSYGINLTKKFSDGADAQSLFDDVLFTVKNSSDGLFIIASLNEEEGIWYVTGNTDKESEATKMHPVTWNSKKGQLVVKGLENDKYILTEVETANSYTLLKEDIEVVISLTDDVTRPCDVYDTQNNLGVIQNDPRFNFDGALDLTMSNIAQEELAHNLMSATATVDGNDVTMLADEVDTTSDNALVPMTVMNSHGFNLPQTGQNGTKWLPIIGGSLIGLAAILLFTFLMYKRKEEDRGDA